MCFVDTRARRAGRRNTQPEFFFLTLLSLRSISSEVSDEVSVVYVRSKLIIDRIKYSRPR